MNTQTLSIRQAILGVEPYALVTVDPVAESASVEVGGFDTSDAASVLGVALAVAEGARFLKRRSRELRREARKAARS